MIRKKRLPSNPNRLIERKFLGYLIRKKRLSYGHRLLYENGRSYRADGKLETHYTVLPLSRTVNSFLEQKRALRWCKSQES